MPPGKVLKMCLDRNLRKGFWRTTVRDLLVPQHFHMHFGLRTALLLALHQWRVMRLLWRWYRRRRQQHPDYQRARRAGQRALTALRALKTHQAQGDASRFDGVHQALTGYLSDKLHLAGAGLTVDDVTRHLQARQLDPALLEQVATLLHLCDSARYAPGSLAVAQSTGFLEDAEALVQRLEESGRL